MSPSDVQEKVLEPILVAGIRMKGRYSDCGKAFGQLCRKLGRHAFGKPMLLHYDAGYRETDADFEACLPLRHPKESTGITLHTLPGGKCVTFIHKGPYDQLSQSYAILNQYLNDNGFKVARPTREIYIKGPGMIFKGNPRNYLTEIQMLLET